MSTMTLICIVTSVLLGVVGQLVLKYGMTKMGPLSLSGAGVPSLLTKIATSPWIILGLAIYATATFFWLIALSRVELAYAYPFASLSYVFMLASAWLLLGEKVGPTRLGGVVLILFGVLVISRT